MINKKYLMNNSLKLFFPPVPGLYWMLGAHLSLYLWYSSLSRENLSLSFWYSAWLEKDTSAYRPSQATGQKEVVEVWWQDRPSGVHTA